MHNEVAGADERIEDVNVRGAKRLAKLFLQNVFDATHHEVHDRYGRINDAVRVGYLHREALKELFIDSVQEFLFLGELFNCSRGLFNRHVEPIELLQESIASKGLRRQRVDYLFNLGRNYVAPREVGIVEDGAKDTFSKQVLNEHLFDRFFRKIWIDGLSA